MIGPPYPHTRLGLGLGHSIGPGKPRRVSRFYEAVRGALPTEVWDPGIGYSLSDATHCSSLRGMVRPGVYDLTGTVRPIWGVDAKGAYLDFDAGPYMICNAIGVALAGNSVPFWVVAAIENITRDATARCLWCATTAAVNPFVASLPNYNATRGRGYRTNDAGVADTTAILETTAAAGVWIDRYSGSQRTVRLGADVSPNAAQASVCTTTQFTIGAFRRTAVAQQFVGRLRGFAIGVNATLSDASRDSILAELTAFYGW